MCFSTALLRDRVYIVKPMLPWAGWALTPPFQPYLADSCESAGRYISVALVLGSPPAGVTRYPCPVKPGLSSQGYLSTSPARPSDRVISLYASTRYSVSYSDTARWQSDRCPYLKPNGRIKLCRRVPSVKAVRIVNAINTIRSYQIAL